MTKSKHISEHQLLVVAILDLIYILHDFKFLMDLICGPKKSQRWFYKRVVLRNIRILNFTFYWLNVNWMLVACMIPYRGWRRFCQRRGGRLPLPVPRPLVYIHLHLYTSLICIHQTLLVMLCCKYVYSDFFFCMVSFT